MTLIVARASTASRLGSRFSALAFPRMAIRGVASRPFAGFASALRVPFARSSPRTAALAVFAIVAAAGAAVASSPVHADAATAASGHSISQSDHAVLEPSSTTLVPKSLALHFDNKTHSFSLVGFGIRQVTLLNFNVYVAALYADKRALETIRNSARWQKDYSPVDIMLGTQDSFYMKDFVRAPKCEITLMIEPVRTTTGAHLRQGFTRFLNGRIVKDVKDGAFASEAQKRAAEEAIAELERIFPVGTIPKNSKLFFTKTEQDNLRIEYEGRQLALIKSPWLAHRFFEGYLSHEKPISDKVGCRTLTAKCSSITAQFRKSVADAFARLAKGEAPADLFRADLQEGVQKIA
ncbi:hypothetical protein HDU83_006143 [Entophlyctis luteolus]|nr:hypothetical protein HDU82_005526 [Entophlyctis luteolus]KAJ3353938.1 hypothetical protein HDU83_006143 [Entophlyctis luteolus]KAJ3389852.1 hypothetical protein HDU84_008222 [Entophlyctis sp. JEL0112]